MGIYEALTALTCFRMENNSHFNCGAFSPIIHADNGFKSGAFESAPFLV